MIKLLTLTLLLLSQPAIAAYIPTGNLPKPPPGATTQGSSR